VRDVIVMWRSTKMAVLAALCAALYAALLIPFKAIPLIPGFTEIRPGNVVPVVAGLLFGPPAAWGCAFGNLIADFFGTIGPGSFFGFIGNFLLAYVPYRLWRMLSPRHRATGVASQAVLYVIVAVVGSMTCAVVIGWGCEMLKLAPYAFLTAVITINNAAAAIILGPLVLPLLYARARRWGLLYEDLMPARDCREGPLAPLGAALVLVGSLGGSPVAIQMFLATKIEGWTPILPESFPLVWVGTVCALMIIVGSALFARAPSRDAEEPIGAATSLESTGDQAIVADDLRFRYALGDGQALDGVSFTQPRGQLRLLMGPTGAGKSTLCKCLNGVIPSLETGEFSGTVSLFGHDISGRPVHTLAPLIGEVFQDFESQLLTSSVEAEVAFPLENIGVELSQMQVRVRQALDDVEMWQLRKREPTSLSGGEKQRVALAATLVADPQIVVLDEPTTDLDPQGKRELLVQCEKLREDGRTLILAEHETELALQADVLTVLKDGAVAYDGPPSELLTDPDRTEALGLRPHDIPALFQALGRPERPLTVDEAAPLLSDMTFDEREWEDVSTPWMAAAYGEASGGLDTPVIWVQDAQYSYDDRTPAIKGVSFEVYEGEFVAILGENGSGKTTLAKHLNGLLCPTQGRVVVVGNDTHGQSTAELSSTVGYLFQDPDHQIFAETVYQEVAFGLLNLDVPFQDLSKRVDETLESMGLTEVKDADPFTLTKGQRQQVALASVLAMKPRVIVFDEPTTGLDGPQQKAMMERLRDLNDAGHTIIVITHCAWAAAEYPHRVIALANGEILADVPTRDLFSDKDLLARAGQRAPQITELSERVWGRTVLSIEEAVRCLRGGVSQ